MAESVHQLQRAIHGGQVAPERGRRRQEMAAISGAHALLTNIVLAWNTNRMDTVVTKLNRDGVGIEEDWLRRIGPAHFSHINFRGTFRFNVERYADAGRARRRAWRNQIWPVRTTATCRRPGCRRWDGHLTFSGGRSRAANDPEATSAVRVSSPRSCRSVRGGGHTSAAASSAWWSMRSAK